MEQFKELLKMINEGLLLSATLSAPRLKSTTLIENEEMKFTKISIRPVILKKQTVYQLSAFTKQQVFHRNLTFSELGEFIENELNAYQQAVFAFESIQFHVWINQQGKITLKKKEIKSQKTLLDHNRFKKHLLNEGEDIPFLMALGIMSKDKRVLTKRYDKFRQINRFLEMVQDIVFALPKDKELEVIDFGCGKGYLTFALYHYLTQIENRKVKMVGLDLKREVIETCQQLAIRLGFTGLLFQMGDINQFEYTNSVDLMVALHACDTATDAALEKAVRWQAKVILCAPCCQHELYSQIKCETLNSLFRHGILKERIAALTTDAVRAELLIMLGYEVQILEFIDMEHTPKNLLLRATKGVSKEKQEGAKKRYLAIKHLLNLSPSLEQRFDLIH